jgi:DNA-directed RNA polymerase specialized sigma subunit
MKKYILILLLLVSCDVTKEAVKTKTDRDLTEIIKTTSKRVGDTVSYTVPKIVLKDTTIYTVNRVGTRIETRYNKDGNIDLINCMASNIDEMKEENRRMLEIIKDKEKSKEENFNSGALIGVVSIIGIVFLLCVFLMIKYIKPF